MKLGRAARSLARILGGKNAVCGGILNWNELYVVASSNFDEDHRR